MINKDSLIGMRKTFEDVDSFVQIMLSELDAIEEQQKALFTKQKELQDLHGTLSVKEAKIHEDRKDIDRQKRLIGQTLFTIDEKEASIVEREKLISDKQKAIEKALQEYEPKKDILLGQIKKLEGLQELKKTLDERETNIIKQEAELQNAYKVDMERKNKLDSKELYLKKEKVRLQEIAKKYSKAVL